MDLDVDEALRYLGASGADDALRQRAETAAAAVQAACTPRWVLRECAVEQAGEAVALPELGVTLPGSMARTMLAECPRAAILTCTLGLTFDALLRQAQARDMAWAVLLDACGSAYVEAGCDAAEAELRARHPNLYLTDRFSPGYGDLPLSVQRGLLAAVDAQRRLGVCLTDTDLMQPAKTVTAVIGLSETIQRARIRGCAHCMLRGRCAYRERGEKCGN